MANYLPIILGMAALALNGCTTPNDVAKPSDITLEKAIFDVADSLNNLQARTGGRAKVGLIVDEATVTFNVAASANNAATGSASLDIPVSAGGKAGLSVSNTLTNNADRGNTITVVFKNIGTADYSKGGLTMLERCRKNPKLPECKKNHGPGPWGSPLDLNPSLHDATTFVMPSQLFVSALTTR